jgi:hypothetical protein
MLLNRKLPHMEGQKLFPQLSQDELKKKYLEEL